MLQNFIRWCLFFISSYGRRVEEDESSQLKGANWPAVLAGYRPLLTALTHTCCSLRSLKVHPGACAQDFPQECRVSNNPFSCLQGSRL